MCHLESWGFPAGSDTSSTVALVVAELAANAVRHGRGPGRHFGMRLSYLPDRGAVRVEVSDARADRLPVPVAASCDGESGRGLLLVDALARTWGAVLRGPLGKTVWAEVDVTE